MFCRSRFSLRAALCSGDSGGTAACRGGGGCDGDHWIGADFAGLCTCWYLTVRYWLGGKAGGTGDAGAAWCWDGRYWTGGRAGTWRNAVAGNTGSGGDPRNGGTCGRVVAGGFGARG